MRRVGIILYQRPLSPSIPLFKKWCVSLIMRSYFFLYIDDVMILYQNIHFSKIALSKEGIYNIAFTKTERHGFFISVL